MGEADRPQRSTYLLVGAVSIALVVGWLVAPHLLKGLVGSAVAGAVALGSAQKIRRRANKAHADQIKVETEHIDNLEDSSEAAVAAAETRSSSNPQAGADGLTAEERRARLDAASQELK